MARLQSNLTLGALIAAGHFGEVYAGRDDVHGQVAVKVFRQNIGESQADWQARKAGLLAEGQRLKQATHRNVVQVFQLLESGPDDKIHLVMEYCSGGSLQQPFEQGPMILKDIRDLVTQVCFGLQALHSRGMLHRDIKPGNILRDGNGVGKLGDFGLVTDNLIFGYASQQGYLDHLAYEVWNGSGTSVRSDIWALGMTVFRLIHGHQWYLRFPQPQMIVRSGGFRDTLKWLPHVPKRWRRFVRQMLHDDPDSRHQDAGQVIAALSDLSIVPEWRCTVAQSEIRWEQEVGNRRKVVIWRHHAARSYDWQAWSEPVGAGRKRNLGRSNGTTGYNQSKRELQDFFATP
jgi:serine/threonine-protein kinase